MRKSKVALKEIGDKEIEKLVQKQNEVGLKAITDGEFRRRWWHQRIMNSRAECVGYFYIGE